MSPIGYSAYNKAAEQTTDNKEKILLMLLDGAIRFTRFAKMGLERKSPKLKGENISKVIAIISELDCALDKEVNEELVYHLSGLYQYILTRLTHANINNVAEPLQEVEEILTKIKEGFEGIVTSKSKSNVHIKDESVDSDNSTQRLSLAA